MPIRPAKIDANRLVRQYAEATCPRQRHTLRAAAVEAYRPLVHKLAGRYRGRGVDHDDLAQVASVGLLKALERFDPSRKVGFVTFATPTITGEIKRYFRDYTWRVHVPRELQELNYKIRNLNDAAFEERGRYYTIAELAELLDETEREITEALLAWAAYEPDSLDTPLREDEDEPIQIVDRRSQFTGEIADRVSVEAALEYLSERERYILDLRFGREMTQAEVGRVLGVSQMQISRYLRSILEKLRTITEQPTSPREEVTNVVPFPTSVKPVSANGNQAGNCLDRVMQLLAERNGFCDVKDLPELADTVGVKLPTLNQVLVVARKEGKLRTWRKGGRYHLAVGSAQLSARELVPAPVQQDDSLERAAARLREAAGNMASAMEDVMSQAREAASLREELDRVKAERDALVARVNQLTTGMAALLAEEP